MITDIILFIVGLFVWTISQLFGFIEYALPQPIFDAITTAFGYVRMADGLLPLLPDPTLSGLPSTMGLLTIVGWTLQFIVAFYLIKLLLFVVGLIPFFGKKISLPQATEGEAIAMHNRFKKTMSGRDKIHTR